MCLLLARRRQIQRQAGPSSNHSNESLDIIIASLDKIVLGPENSNQMYLYRTELSWCSSHIKATPLNIDSMNQSNDATCSEYWQKPNFSVVHELHVGIQTGNAKAVNGHDKP